MTPSEALVWRVYQEESEADRQRVPRGYFQAIYDAVERRCGTGTRRTLTRLLLLGPDA